jgi:hypothetical protein
MSKTWRDTCRDPVTVIVPGPGTVTVTVTVTVTEYLF